MRSRYFMKKKFLALLLCTVLTVSCIVPVYAAEVSAELYKIYDDDMLFEQEKDAVFAGKAPAGSTVSAELFDADGKSVTSGEAVTDTDGKFTVSFVAPKGAFEEYTVVLKCNGTEFDSLERVVFGELWLAGGQSNMMYPLSGALTGAADFENGVKQSKWIRAMLSDAYSEDGIPVEPREDIPDANWVTGEDRQIYSMSAVGFFFAEELLEELDVPVGILNISLGGTSIGTWLSREAIDSDEQVKNDFLADDWANPYIEAENWVPDEADYYNDMSANYNLRIEAVKHFRPSGMIWYQGETDFIYRWSTERYGRALDLLQRSYTELFEYDDGLMPFVCTQIAPYFYWENCWEHPDWNCGYTSFCEQQPESRAVVTLYDLPVTFLPEVGVIHPEHKEEVGDRMAACAVDMVYLNDSSHSAASVNSVEISDGSIYVSFNSCGDGLVANGKVLYGFAICGEDGVYVQADAQITDKDTVKIWADSVENPVSATYAYAVAAQTANLYSAKGGELYLPVSPFVTDPAYSAQYWVEKPWADCETDTVWHTHDDTFSAYYNTWTAENASVSFTDSSAYSGTNGMNIKATDTAFSVSPLRTFEDSNKEVVFRDCETQFDNYGTVSFYVRNNGTQDITFDGLKLYKNAALWYSPADVATGEPESVIPADGEWHLVTLDLNRLCLWGNECGISFPNDKLGTIRDIVFCFSGENADVSIDHIRFAPSTEDVGCRFDVNISNADNIFEVISAVFVTVIGAIVNLFN